MEYERDLSLTTSRLSISSMRSRFNGFHWTMHSAMNVLLLSYVLKSKCPEDIVLGDVHWNNSSLLPPNEPSVSYVVDSLRLLS